MTTQSKSYMNFLGGEVSPNAYKRLDMAGNSKWFETAKNIYFGTTGDVYNRRGFRYISKTASGSSGEKIKLIPFIFNRSQSYCIEFNSNTFRILKDGQLLKDNLDNIIEVRHDGVSVSSIDDLSYAQVGDVLYITSGGRNRIYTITRYSETDWRWELFDYSIPPMRKVNDDKDKSILFAENTSYDSSGQFQLDVSAYGSTLADIVVYAKESDTWSAIYTAAETLGSWNSFVLDFNASQTATTKINTCSLSNNTLTFFCTTAGNSIQGIRIKIGANSRQEKNYSFQYGNPNYAASGGSTTMYYYYNCPNTAIVKSVYWNRIIDWGANFNTSNFNPPNYATPSEAASAINGGGDYSVWYEQGNNRFVCHLKTQGADQDLLYKGTKIYSFATLEPLGEDVIIETESRITIEAHNQVYNTNANFNFFQNKEVGEIFAIDSIFSPNRDGKAGENKSYYAQGISSGSFDTDAFWSNGNWRIVTSGLFAGTIELQYSYDGSNWYTHRTFSSSIRTESNVSYSTNYNEYGKIEADDNILLRLHFQTTTATNLAVLLDTESFKNRSYYQILEKDSVTPNTKAIVKCVLYSVGTPGLTKAGADPGSYDVNRVYEWSEAAWSYAHGYPKIGFLYQNRLAFANTEKDNSTIWFSKTNNYKDFSTKIEYQDDDPITITVLKPTGISEITGIAASKKLFVFSGDREYGIKDEGALTQANKELVSFSTYGSEPIETQVVSNRVIFVEHGGKAARALIYDYAQENYQAPDLTIPFKHLLTNESIIETGYISGEYKTYLMLTSLGRILVFKYIPEQKIEACSWFKHPSGSITNVCVINNGDAYDMYIALDTENDKHLEYMHIVPYTQGVYLDCYKIYSYSSAVFSITDSDYFVSGQKYIVIADGIKYQVEADNTHSITLNSSAKEIIVGLPYVSEATMIEPNLMFQSGTTNYNRKNMFKAHFSFLDSIGFQVGTKNKQKNFKKMYALQADSIDDQMALQSGERNFVIQSSYLEPNMLSFVQEEPYNMHITNAEIEVDYGGK